MPSSGKCAVCIALFLAAFSISELTEVCRPLHHWNKGQLILSMPILCFVEYSRDLLGQVQRGSLVTENFTFPQHHWVFLGRGEASGWGRVQVITWPSLRAQVTHNGQLMCRWLQSSRAETKLWVNINISKVYFFFPQNNSFYTLTLSYCRRLYQLCCVAEANGVILWKNAIDFLSPRFELICSVIWVIWDSIGCSWKTFWNANPDSWKAPK